MTVLFFMWGFMTVWNDVLIPRFKEAFSLTYFQAMLVQLSFFGAYAVGSLLYYLISLFSGDPINRLGYKNGVVIGLGISAVGSALFYPAAALVSYPFFLCALFVVGLGFAMLQIAANPYVTILGPERTASSRLNLSQAFNSLGTTMGPVIGGWLIFNVFTSPGQHGADSVRLPYLILAGVFAVLAVGFAFARLPDFRTEPDPMGARGVFRFPHFLFGVGAIFMYVGGEVSTGSAIVNLLGLPSMGGLSHQAASHYLAYYWGGLMIGRLMGAFSLSDLRPVLKRLLVAAVPLAAFGVVLLVSPVAADALRYGLLLAVLYVAFLAGGASAPRMLTVFSVLIVAMLLVAMLGSGELAKWCILGVGLFCSVMWSNIFSLAIEGLGPLKSQASSLLVMAILGGALLPPLQGYMADLHGIQFSFIIPAFAFAYVAFYGLIGHRIGRR
jgi:FHS family L-fucose permease-like MFS transporter